ncbi:MAG: Xaa-Pro peptidase family protein [Oscillospiraceae bacterium]|jgi:Xaa-Pro dipeptidase|nr:Xaa-Pro peptidase family protein [Oscillospiraceae bacterium]
MGNIRLGKTFIYLDRLGLRQAIVSDPLSIFYLTGQRHYPGERLLLLRISADSGSTLYLNELSEDKGTVDGIETIQFNLGEDGLKRVAADLDQGAALGVDKDLPARFLLPIQEYSGIREVRLASEAVDHARQVKDLYEQGKMILASQINDAAMEQFAGLIHEGVTEREVRDRMDGIYRSLGADRVDFGIVAFGAGAAEPHHMGGDAVLREGDAVLLDVGCVKDGYCSDMTRTFFYKEASPRQREVYGLVKRANEAAEAMVRPGVRFSELDAAARDVITQAGYGPQFYHRLGHSIGLTGHEAGDVSAYNHNVLEEGMVFSIEPGIYLEGEFGVRIEDLVLVTSGGARVLNGYTKELVVLG